MTLAGQTVTVRQLVPVPPERAYDAWLDPELLARWWWPELPDTTFMVQAAVGGRFRVRSEAAGIGAHGMFLELVTGERIVMTWVWETGPAESPEDLVTVRFVSHAGGTEVVLDHAMAVPSEDTSRMEQGWAEVLAELNAIHGG